MPYIGKAPSSGIRSRFIYTATAAQTTFTGADGNGKTLGYTDGEYVDVYLNGVLLDPADYTATSKTSVVLDSGATVSDIVEIVVYDTFSVFNGTFTGDLTVDGDTLFVDSTNNRVGIGTTSPQGGTGLHIKTGASGATPNGDLIIEDDANVKMLLSCPAANTGQIHFGDDAANNVGKIQYDHSNDSMAFATSATERMRINSSGNVGIGLTDPDTPLEVQIGSSGNALKLSSDTDGASVFLAFEHQESGTKHVRGRIRAASSGVNGGLIFETGASSSTSERMRILSNGHVLINTTSEIGTTFLNIDGASSSVNGIAVQNSSDSGTIFSLFIRNASGSTIGSITNDGSTVDFNDTSDYRLKENVTDITDGITRLKLLNPSRFNFIANPDKTVDGFLAHEVSDIVPEAITGEKDAMMDEEYVATPATGEIYTPAQEATYDADGNELTAATNEVVHSTDVEKPDTLEEGRGWRETTEAVMRTRSVPSYQGIDKSKLVPLLTAALQEAVAKIETLEAKVTALENA